MEGKEGKRRGREEKVKGKEIEGRKGEGREKEKNIKVCKGGILYLITTNKEGVSFFKANVLSTDKRS
jgi:hypothetical protein